MTVQPIELQTDQDPLGFLDDYSIAPIPAMVFLIAAFAFVLAIPGIPDDVWERRRRRRR